MGFTPEVKERITLALDYLGPDLVETGLSAFDEYVNNEYFHGCFLDVIARKHTTEKDWTRLLPLTGAIEGMVWTLVNAFDQRRSEFKELVLEWLELNRVKRKEPALVEA